jgi:arginyl-tRNA--protein-N-Asp/Glu arginylyltransferase
MSPFTLGNSKCHDSIENILKNINEPTVTTNVYKLFNKYYTTINKLTEKLSEDKAVFRYVLQLILKDRNEETEKMNVIHSLKTHIKCALKARHRKALKDV